MSDKERRGLPWGFVWPCVDGKPVVPGDVLWDSDGTRRRVTEVRFWREGCYVVMDDRSEWGGLVMDREYARTEPPKPVLDRDGVPIEVGDTVYALTGDAEGSRLTVERVGRGTFCVRARSASGHVYQFRGEDLTHEEPDSWERLEKDAAKGACAYFDSSEFACKECLYFGREHDCSGLMAMDIVRRAKALAGVGADE